MTAAQKILRKTLVAADIPSAQWSLVDAQLRDRAFFSSRVTSLKFLHAAREMVAARAGGRLSESEIRRELRRVLDGEGWRPEEGDEGTVKDLRTKARLDLVIRTNTQQARGWVRHVAANTPGAFAAFPAQELVRVRGRRKPRDWDKRWRDAGGRLHGGRMVALKDDPVWTAISAFGQPYPPFDFNSGMGVRDVSRRDAIALGLVTDGELKEKVRERMTAEPPSLNNGLQAEVPFKNDREWQMVKEAFGDQIQIDRKRGVIKWRDELFEENFDKGGTFTFRLGRPTEDLLAKLPEGIDAAALRKKPLTIDQNWINNTRDNGTDHRSHFEPLEKDPRNIPLKKRDTALLSPLWHSPDRVFNSHGRLVLELDALDGSIFRAVVDVAKNPTLKTFYRTMTPYKKAVRT